MAATSITVVSPGTGVSGGLEGVNIVPDSLAAIAKAVTAAYLSTEGNAFTTRTASQIVQAHFNPNDNRQPGGPLFGVQFSQLPCSDLSNRFSGISPGVGPQRSPLGLSADPGGLPLYKGGTPVGGIGVISDGTYSFDPDVTDTDIDDDELIAVAGASGFAAPADRVVPTASASTAACCVSVMARRPNSTRIRLRRRHLRASITYRARSLPCRVTRWHQLRPGCLSDNRRRASARMRSTIQGSMPTYWSMPPTLNAIARRPEPDGANALTAGEVQAILTEAMTICKSLTCADTPANWHTGSRDDFGGRLQWRHPRNRARP